MIMDLATLVDNFPVLGAGAVRTLQLLVWTLLLGFMIALPVALARNSVDRRWRAFAHGFIFFFRGAPLLVVVFLLYYGLPQIPGVRESPLWLLIERPMPVAVFALSLNSAGFLAEVIAGALRNVPRNEIDAARAFGFTRRQIFIRFVARSAARLGIRGYSNEVIFVLKGTAVVNFITITDLVGAANQVYFNTFDPITPLLVAGLMYLAVVFLILLLVKWAERRLSPWLYVSAAA
ncbi:MAG: ABC transporter permease subunit [Pseudomonadota bacterium]|nr:ABC transporter permease subunit [Pseudomonadota bacterium]